MLSMKSVEGFCSHYCSVSTLEFGVAFLVILREVDAHKAYDHENCVILLNFVFLVFVT